MICIAIRVKIALGLLGASLVLLILYGIDVAVMFSTAAGVIFYEPLCPNNEKHVHDIRTSLRRLDTFYSLLPKKLRRRNSKQIEKYKDFFRADSKVRYLDIIRNKVAELAKGAPDASKLEQQLQRNRQAELRRAVKLAKALEKLPSIDIKSTPPCKIESRINKMIDRLRVRVKEILPIILSDSTKKEELHMLRKNCKKLRYIFEILPESHIKKYSKKIVDAIGAKDLKEIQEMLGAIRDSDITIEYLQNSRSGFANQLVVKEAGKRDYLYRGFIKYMKE
jgi:CHAD domain-containing protein